MISVEEAKNIIQDAVVPLPPAPVSLHDAAGLVLAEDVFARADIPAFNQSSMDGYAFSFTGWQLHQSLTIAGEVPAGSNGGVVFSPDIAVRIFTGAPVPEGADTVVMQEKAVVAKGRLIIGDSHLTAGVNVRTRGSEIKQGALALEAGTLLSPAATGFLAGAGVTNVVVYPKPRISIIVTGKELQEPGEALEPGQVYESNSYTLTAALAQLDISGVKICRADDDLEILQHVLAAELQESDVVLLTGGISVGDYDFVLAAATGTGVSKLFHRIRQRPGKPLYFGKKDRRLVFGLPGNPSSVLTCFYEYVLPALNLLSNRKKSLQAMTVVLAKTLAKPPGLTHFLKARFDGQKVLPLDAQESYRLSSYARANCLIQLDEGTEQINEGDKVEIHLIPE